MEKGGIHTVWKKLLTIVASMALAVGCMLPQPLHAEEPTEATVKTKETITGSNQKRQYFYYSL